MSGTNSISPGTVVQALLFDHHITLRTPTAEESLSLDGLAARDETWDDIALDFKITWRRYRLLGPLSFLPKERSVQRTYLRLDSPGLAEPIVLEYESVPHAARQIMNAVSQRGEDGELPRTTGG